MRPHCVRVPVASWACPWCAPCLICRAAVFDRTQPRLQFPSLSPCHRHISCPPGRSTWAGCCCASRGGQFVPNSSKVPHICLNSFLKEKWILSPRSANHQYSQAQPGFIRGFASSKGRSYSSAASLEVCCHPGCRSKITLTSRATMPETFSGWVINQPLPGCTDD